MFYDDMFDLLPTIPKIATLVAVIGMIVFSCYTAHKYMVETGRIPSEEAVSDVENTVQKPNEEKHEYDVIDNNTYNSVVVKDNKIGSGNTTTVTINIGGKSLLPWVLLLVVFGLWIRSKIFPKKPKEYRIEDKQL